MCISDVWIVPMTHWDRAWYQPFEEMRARLVAMVDHLLDVLNNDPRFASFSFDGQTIPLEDYLQIRPERAREISRLVKSGRLEIGPWYVLPDAYLVSAESLIRNLTIGRSIARSFGKTSNAGYIPDPFGYPSAMPTILSGFGIDTFIFTRGAPPETGALGVVFRWVGPDGKSQVMAIRQIGAYWALSGWGARANFPAEDPDSDMKKAMEQIDRAIGRFEKEKLPVRDILITCGVDHQLAQPSFPALISAARKHVPGKKLHHATFDAYAAALRKENPLLKEYEGELHSGWQQALLSGTFSARLWIKQENFACQRLLEQAMEPVDAFLSASKGACPNPFVEYAWKELLKTHPHDDICGCSVDSVHEDDRTQFCHVKQVVAESMRTGFKQVAASMGFRPSESGMPLQVLVYNPDCRETGVETAVELKNEDIANNPRAWRVRRADGKVLSFQASGKKLMFWDDSLPATGYAVYFIEQGGSGPKSAQISAHGATIENSFLKATLKPNGSVDLIDKKTKRLFANCNLFEDTEDAGDEYDYSPLKQGPNPIRFERAKGRVADARLTPGSAEVSALVSLRVPESLNEQRTGRSGVMVDIPVEVTIRLRPDSRRLEFVTSVSNVAKDHRLRVLFPTGIRASQVIASSHFDLVTRPVDIVKGTEDHNQPTVPTQHMDEFVSVQHNHSGAMLVSKGLPEYEAIDEKTGVTFALTLLRCVSWLSRQDLVGRHFHAGPALETPGAQCLGSYTFEYAFEPYEGDVVASGAARSARSYTMPKISYQFEGLLDESKAIMPLIQSWLSVDRPEIAVSSIKRARRGNRIVVRLFNMSTYKIAPTLAFFANVRSAHLARLDETPIEAVPHLKNQVRLSLAGKEVKTVMVGVE
jgi:alpha-mannosidase